ncbi:MAG: hypothetical protein ABI779_18765 [Acidobacteriota bacterium]
MNASWLLVLVVYGVAVSLARRAGADLPRRVALLFLVLVFAFLWQPLTQRVILVPADVLKLTPPWSEMRAPGRPPVTKYEVSNLNLHDVPMQIVPWLHQVRESWRAGRIPLWNEAAGCGYPMLGNGQSTPFSPFHLVTLVLPLGYAITAEAALKLLLALVFTYLFCRLRYSPLASVLAAIAYGFSTWMVTWLQFPIAAAAAMLPGVLLAVERLVERGGLRGQSDVGETRAPARGPIPLAVAIFSLTVLSGHPETIFNIGLIALAHGLWIANARGLLRVAGACLLAACITAPVLAPFGEAVLRSQRLAEVQVKNEVIPPYSDRASAVLLLQPRFFGELPIERPWGPTSLESVCGFAGVLALSSVVAAMVFIVRGRRWRERETLYVLGAVVSLGIILGWPGITQVFEVMAGLAPAMRMRMGICWFAAVLIAAVVDWTRREGAAPLLFGALVVALTMLRALGTTPFPSDSHRVSAILSLLPSLAVLAAVALTAFRRGEALVLAGALTVLELWSAMAHWNPILPARALRPETPLIARLQSLRGLHRIVGMGGQLYPNTGAYFGLEDVRVHDPMASRRYVELLTQKAGWNAADYYAKWNDPSSPLLDRLNVKYIVSDRALKGLPLVYQGRDGWIYENRGARPRFYSDSAEVSIVRASGDAYQMRIRARQHALISSSVMNEPGWTAGRFRVFDGDGPFVAFMVPPGEHEVEVRYRPRSFYAMVPLSLLTLAGLLVAARIRKKRKGT